jgi:acetyl coenzyme A synthetase (ADP forming)-like protein
MIDIDSIFYPKSVAIIGASRHIGSVGHSLLANIIDSRFQGVVYPVNPNAQAILGIKCYPRVLDIPDDVDLAVVIVPAHLVPQVMEECGVKGIKGAIIISAGFKEIGVKGREKERAVIEIIQKYSIALVGPNCLGVVNTASDSSMNATFGTQMPKQGNIAFISQSGALCVAVLDYAKEANIGFSKFISMGNKAGLTENDLLVYLNEDPLTDVILMYLEDLVDGREFMSIARKITSHRKNPKPIIALKAGRTFVGAKAASSHTGSLAGSDKVYDAIFDQCGVIRGDTLEEIFDYVKAFSSQPLPKGKNVAIVTNSGGPGILATDSCIKYGLNLATLSKTTKKTLNTILPPTASLNNPLDLIAEAQHEQFEVAIRAMLSQKSVHSALIILTPTAFTDVEKISKAIIKVAKKIKKPVATCLLGVYDVSRGINLLEENNIPDYRFPESAARVLAEMAKFTSWLNRPKTRVKKYEVDKKAASQIIERVKSEGRSFLLEQECYDVLNAYGFPVIRSVLAADEAQAQDAAEKIGFPVVMKIASPDVLHKFDVGGVILDVKNKLDVKKAYRKIQQNIRSKMPKAKITGIIVEEMAVEGKEVILGMNHDEQFGPILMFGMGGIYVEALEDVIFRLAPIRELTADMMIEKTKTYKILDGYRGGPVYDTPAIADCLKRLSKFVTDFEDIKELDINPLIVYEEKKGCKIVDARIILKEKGTSH